VRVGVRVRGEGEGYRATPTVTLLRLLGALSLAQLNDVLVHLVRGWG
jgi:hypothetical protein